MNRTHLTALIFSLFFMLPDQALAQSGQSEAQNQKTGGYFDIGLKTGSLLPYDIEGVRELLPMWGVKLGHSMGGSLALEYDFDFANAKGVTYYLAYLSLRHDFVVGNVVPLFFTVGVDGHYYKRKDTYGEITGRLTEYDFQFKGGWHLGFGTETSIYKSILFRTDFRMGFGPGQQLIVALGLIYRF